MPPDMTRESPGQGARKRATTAGTAAISARRGDARQRHHRSGLGHQPATIEMNDPIGDVEDHPDGRAPLSRVRAVLEQDTLDKVAVRRSGVAELTNAGLATELRSDLPGQHLIRTPDIGFRQFGAGHSPLKRISQRAPPIWRQRVHGQGEPAPARNISSRIGSYTAPAIMEPFSA